MAGARTRFYEIVNAAINDLALHGYDSVERVARWSAEIRRAAEAVARPGNELARMLRDALEAVFKRLVEQGGAIKASPGISRFTIEMVRPELRAELDRRILAAAGLIKLNREEAIDKTIRRFQGWATSLPAGGSAEPERAATKASVRKSVAGLPFRERRLLIDQGHKLGAAINATVAEGGGAIAAIWHSNFRQAGYDYRVDHKERDAEIYLIKGSWAHTNGLVKPGPAGYTDQITQPAEEPYCRCRYEYLFHLRQLPEDMLTRRGAEQLEEVRIKVHG